MGKKKVLLKKIVMKSKLRISRSSVLNALVVKGEVLQRRSCCNSTYRQNQGFIECK